MRHSRFTQAIALITLSVFLTSCVTTHVPPISSVGDSFEPEKDEARLWYDARAEENKLRSNVKIYQDPLLDEYLEGVVSHLNPPAMAANPQITYRVTVLEDATLNAFAYPTGSLYVNTGLLARMDDEDELATVLGHEMTHVENRHMLRYQRSARNKQIGFAIASVAGAVIIAGEEGRAAEQGKYGKAARIRVLSNVMLGLGLSLAVMAAVNGYGRDLEREADGGGFEKMSQAGYDVREAPRVYKALLDDHGDPGKAEAFFFGNHPRLDERIASAEQWARDNPDRVHPTCITDQQDFKRRMRPVIRDDARLNLEMGRLNLAQDELKKAIDELPTDAQAHFLMGRVKLKKAEGEKKTETQQQLRSEAAASFAESARLNPDLAGPHRELGLLAYHDKRFETACAEFADYLRLDSKADDAQSLRDYLLELQRDGHCK